MGPKGVWQRAGLGRAVDVPAINLRGLGAGADRALEAQPGQVAILLWWPRRSPLREGSRGRCRKRLPVPMGTRLHASDRALERGRRDGAELQRSWQRAERPGMAFQIDFIVTNPDLRKHGVSVPRPRHSLHASCAEAL